MIKKIRNFKKSIFKTVLLTIAFSLIFSVAAFAETHTVDNWEDYKNAIKQGIKNQDEIIKIRYVGDETFESNEELINKIESLYDEARAELGYFDNQNVFKTSPAKGSKQLDDGKHALTIGQYRITYKNSSEDIQEINRIIDDFVNDNISDDMEDYEKIQAAYEFILNNYKYQKHATNNNDFDNLLKERSILSGLNGEGVVCDAYSMLFSKMMDSLGYENSIVTGTANGVSHAWNSVKIDDKWYNIDTTWADMEVEEEIQELLKNNPDLDEEFIREFVEQKAQEKKDLYFLASDETLKETHEWDETKTPPAPEAYKKKEEIIEDAEKDGENIKDVEENIEGDEDIENIQGDEDVENIEDDEEKPAEKPITATEINENSIKIRLIRAEDVDKDKIIKLEEDEDSGEGSYDAENTQPSTTTNSEDTEVKSVGEIKIAPSNSGNYNTGNIKINSIDTISPTTGYKIKFNIVE